MSFVEHFLNRRAADDKRQADENREQRNEQYQEKLERLSPEQREEVERIIKRGRVVLRHLTNIRDYNNDILAGREDEFFLNRLNSENFSDNFLQRFSQISQILLGAGPAIAAITLPRTPLEHLLGGAVAFFGGGLAWYRALEWRQHVQPVARKKIQKYRRKKLGERDVSPPEDGFVSEQNLRIEMLDAHDSIIEQRRELRSKLKEFKTFIIEKSDTADSTSLMVELNKLVLAYDTIFEKTITNQERFLNRAPEYEGLASLLTEQRRALTAGFGSATALLVGGKGAGWPPPGLEDFSDSMRGYTSLLVGEHGQRAERSVAAFVGTGLSILSGTIARFALGKKHSEETARRALKSALALGKNELEKLKKGKIKNYADVLKREGRGGIERGEAERKRSTTSDTGSDNKDIERVLDQMQEELRTIAHTPRSVGGMQEILESFSAPTDTAETQADEGGIGGETGLEENAAPLRVPDIESGFTWRVPQSLAPSRDTILTKIHQNTLQPELNRQIAQILESLNLNSSVVQVDKPIEQNLLSIARDPNIPSGVLDAADILFTDFDRTLLDVSPEETIKTHFGVDIFERLKQARAVLVEGRNDKEEREARVLIKDSSPGIVRATILERYGIVRAVAKRRSEEVSELITSDRIGTAVLASEYNTAQHWMNMTDDEAQKFRIPSLEDITLNGIVSVLDIQGNPMLSKMVRLECARRIFGESPDIAEALQKEREMSPEEFETALRAWNSDENIQRAYKISCIRFLEVCKRIIDESFVVAYGGSRADLKEKRNDIKTALGILNIVPEKEMSHPSDEQKFLRELHNIVESYRDIRERDLELKDITHPATLQARFEALASDPLYIHPKMLRFADNPEVPETEMFRVSDFPSMREAVPIVERGVYEVSPKYIIGSIIPRETWIGKNSTFIQNQARSLIDNPSLETFQSCFIDSGSGNPRVVLEKFSVRTQRNEERALYLVKHGHEYVAAAKLAGTPVIASVITRRLPDTHAPLYVEIPNLYLLRKVFLEDLARKGLIDAEFAKKDRVDTVPFQVTVKKLALPWLLLFGSNMLQKFSEKALKVWPDIYDDMRSVSGNRKRLDPDILTKEFSFKQNFRTIG